MASLFRSQDLWAGMLFITVGITAVVLGGEYPMGSSVRMGAGYFPRMIGWLLIAIGTAVAVSGLRRSADKIELGWPGISVALIPAAVAVFAAVLQPIGLPGALVLLTVIAAGASRELRPLEIVAMAAGMAGVFTLLFVKVLGVPLYVWPWFLR